MGRPHKGVADEPLSCCSMGSRRERPIAPAPAAETLHTAPRRPSRVVRLRGGRFRMGVDASPLPQDGESPSRLVTVKPFAIDPFAVTTATFGEFVTATGYRTDAERFGWSLVFKDFVPNGAEAAAAQDEASWWSRIEGACWRDPEGPRTGGDKRPNHPVVHVSWNDAAAFAAWAGGRLPTEAEWEFAAHGGLAEARFPWGDREPDDDAFQPCNIWQGDFPGHNSCIDGHAGTAPVDAFAPNGFGLFNMVGNAWEWCADAFRIRSLARAARQRNEAARANGERLLKGGSYLCHRSYCYRYRIAARTGASADSSTGHVGFRLVFDV